ncbi:MULTISPECIES: hypothetical protein [Halorussus]|uniref:hypothetical protein n=1 Tax=Halorussus TaxID=1070314 RepID=UPI000E20DBDA|nr:MULTISPECIES: hypothetical protein [Halorussus]NHN61084.1 hypothetical protein [Halorussus sp. JP-T4]
MPCKECGASTREGAELCRDCAADPAPTGIKIICALGALSGLFLLLVGLRLLGPAPLVGLVVTGLSIGQLTVLYGLWTLETWSWGVALILYGLGVLADLLRAVTGNRRAVVGAAIGVVLVWYVYSQHEHYLPDETRPAEPGE